ncbi:WAP four-disulfide core domain protein 8 [Haplochromis burtoni]|uniref:WAP four-disulfide core domain protein 8 n=1 Tax=Haplochromis burtoni TaxID=8153 RepID=UPI001C2D1305|nr:WAP four-disulfide core domain protein 8 [Haplochromis burtoni]
MDKLSSTVYVLIVALCAFPHFGTVFHAHALRRGGISTAKPGVCPVRYYIHADCTESCSKDSDCHDNEKCCSNGCGHECMAPVIECPRHLNLALSRKGYEDCPRDHICCVYDGEEVCVPPVSTKPGVCPRRRLDFGHCAEICSNDRDCPNNEKCCSNGCGHECMAPLSECSRHLNLALSRKGYEDCPRSHICCVYDGEEVCVPPAPIKPGVCPHRHLGHGRCLESCFNDRDCPFFEKCCSNGCGHECMAPYKVKPGVCPRRRLGYGRCAEFCSNDSDCPDKEKCCSNGCGHECMAPYVVKPGGCPLPETTPMCAEYCYHDGQCPGDHKCCRTTCGHACSEPC